MNSSELERFEIQQDADEAAEVSERGPWVRYEDAEVVIQEVEKERDGLRIEVDALKFALRKAGL